MVLQIYAHIEHLLTEYRGMFKWLWLCLLIAWGFLHLYIFLQMKT